MNQPGHSDVSGSITTADGTPVLPEILGHGRRLVAKNQFDEAKAFYTDCLKSLEETAGVGHPDFLVVCLELAALHKKTGDYSKADLLLTHALEVVVQQKGKDHPNVSYRLEALAKLYLTAGDYANAEKALSRALEISEKHSDHVASSMAYAALGHIYLEQERLAEAMHACEKRLALETDLLGKINPRVASAINNLGAVYVRQGRADKAAACYYEALGVCERCGGLDLPICRITIQNLVSLCRGGGEHVEADRLESLVAEWHERQESATEEQKTCTEISRSVHESLSTYAGQLGFKAGGELPAGSEERIVRLITEDYADLVATEEGRAVLRSRFVGIFSDTARSLGDKWWGEYIRQYEWLEDVDQRRAFKQGVNWGFLSSAWIIMTRWLDDTSVTQAGIPARKT